MPIDAKKLAAFANQGKKDEDNGGNKPKFGKGKWHGMAKKDDKKPMPFGKKGKGYGGKNGGGEEEGDHEHDDEGDDVDVEAIGERVQDGKGDKRLMKMSKGITEETNPPEWVEDEDIWEKAKDAVEDRWDDYDEPYAVVTHVYQAMGGGIAS